jgi:GTP cyclohydrolase IA
VRYARMMDDRDLEAHVVGLLEAIDPEPRREGLAKTPERVARALRYLTRGYEQDPATIINGALFNENHSEMIVVKDIDFYSLCEHHILPFFGRAHVAYIPRGGSRCRSGSRPRSRTRSSVS